MSQLLPADAAALSGITAFQDLPAEVLAWLAQTGELCQYEDGELIAPYGSPADRLIAVVAGAMQYYTEPGGAREPIFRLDTGLVGGVLPYSRLQVFRGQSEAVGRTVLYILPRTEFPALEQVSPELVQRLVSLMSDRARNEGRTQERDDKLRALGKLAAGLSHELNNPAAAIVRAADALGAHLRNSPVLFKNLLIAGPTPGGMAAIKSLAEPAAAPPATLSALARADQEDALADWLESQAVPDGYTLASGLLEAGITIDKLTPVLPQLPPVARPAALAWLEAHLMALRLAHDMREAGQRISALVSDVKTYSHMDRAGGREKLAITQGLDSTLNIFAHALRQKKARLTRDYAPDLPPIMGKAGSLNQVWTNLIDNALDALPNQDGELRVSVKKQNDFECVSIQDNGAGIAPEVLAHLFEPFYTTKPPGEGSGQGLDIARRIVQEHGGRLEVASEPGRTEFTTWLPIDVR